MIITQDYLKSRAKYYTYFNWFELWPEKSIVYCLQRLRTGSHKSKLKVMYISFRELNED